MAEDPTINWQLANSSGIQEPKQPLAINVCDACPQTQQSGGDEIPWS
jgi:hypothetical protein